MNISISYSTFGAIFSKLDKLTGTRFQLKSPHIHSHTDYPFARILRTLVQYVLKNIRYQEQSPKNIGATVEFLTRFFYEIFLAHLIKLEVLGSHNDWSFYVDLSYGLEHFNFIS